MRGVQRRAGILIAVTIFAVSGCGGGAGGGSGSSSNTKVSGTVKVNGKVPTGAQISFDPANADRPKEWPPRTGGIKPDGTYEVWTLPGENTVSITGPEVAADPKVAAFKKVVNVSGSSMQLNVEAP